MVLSSIVGADIYTEKQISLASRGVYISAKQSLMF